MNLSIFTETTEWIQPSGTIFLSVLLFLRKEKDHPYKYGRANISHIIFISWVSFLFYSANTKSLSPKDADSVETHPRCFPLFKFSFENHSDQANYIAPANLRTKPALNCLVHVLNWFSAGAVKLLKTSLVLYEADWSAKWEGGSENGTEEGMVEIRYILSRNGGKVIAGLRILVCDSASWSSR